MSLLRPLRGACQCGRNSYVIRTPEGATGSAEVIFNTDPIHQIPLGPLAAFIRVPLSWLNSSTHALFPDETHAMIRRVYTHPSHHYARRQFCGFCGTPLSYWSEQPRSEAEYIQLTLGSLLREDLLSLDELGLIPDQDLSEPIRPTSITEPGPDAEQPDTTPENRMQVDESPTSDTQRLHSIQVRETLDVPWFNSLVEGTRLGTMRRTMGVERSRDGRTRREWEIFEWTTDDDGENDSDSPSAAVPHATTSTKRKRDIGDAAMGSS